MTYRKHWSTSTDLTLYEQLRALSARTRIPVSRLLDEAIEDLLVKHNLTHSSGEFEGEFPLNK